MPNDLKKTSAVIYGLQGKTLTPQEKSFFQDSNPLGFILFSRNIDNPAQVSALIRDLRDCIGRHDAPVLIDQEGGRVARLNMPHWPTMPDFRRIGSIAIEGNFRLAIRAAQLHAELIADMFHSVGATVNCSPVLDVLRPETHDVIGDRAFGDDPFLVSRLGYVYAECLMNAGITPVMKHIPGHGRAQSDSHFELPKVDTPRKILFNKDFYPFRAIADCMGRDLWAMTAHVLYTDLDKDNPATTSPTIINEAIRGDIGFEGFLIGDDLSMKALSGTLTERAKAALTAGCDAVLHCNGNMDEMTELAKAIPVLSQKAIGRFIDAEKSRTQGKTALMSPQERHEKHAALYALVRSDDFCVWHPRHAFLNQ